MNLKPGDKVKFLNTTGGGVVTRVLDTRMVLVADEDGFEVPTLISELVKIDPVDAGSRFFREDFPAPVKRGPVSVPDQAPADGPHPGSGGEEEAGPDYLPPSVLQKRTSEDIFLAFVPHDQKWLITGSVDIVLVNNTSCDVIYNLFHRTPLGHFAGVDYGSLFAGTRHNLATVNREQLSHWTDGVLQFLFHREQTDAVFPPFNSEFRIDGRKFHKEGSYRESSLAGGKGILIRILSLTQFLQEAGPGPQEPPSPPAGDALSAPAPEALLIRKHQTGHRKAVVDLHIHELIEDPSNIPAKELLDFQRNYFIRRLDEALSEHFLSVVFIHGVGNGTLRNALTDHLKKTEGIEWSDAPMSVYGIGAIEVRIPHNR